MNNKGEKSWWYDLHGRVSLNTQTVVRHAQAA